MRRRPAEVVYTNPDRNIVFTSLHTLAGAFSPPAHLYRFVSVSVNQEAIVLLAAGECNVLKWLDSQTPLYESGVCSAGGENPLYTYRCATKAELRPDITPAGTLVLVQLSHRHEL